MLVPKIPIDIHLHQHIGRTIGYCGYWTLCCLQYLSIDPEPNRLCPGIGIDPHNCRPIVGPVAYSIGYYPGYEELNGTQTGRSKTLQAWASYQTYINSNHHHVVETIHLKLLRAQQRQTAPYSGILRWAEGACGVDDEWRTRVDCTETGCLWALCSPKLKQFVQCPKVYVSIPLIQDDRMMKRLLIPIVRNNRVVKYLSMPSFRNNIVGLVKCLSIYIVPNNRFGERCRFRLSPNSISPEQPYYGNFESIAICFNDKFW